MKHIHFAWELGGGLGHAGRLKLLAEEALRRGHFVTMSLRDLVHTNNVLHSTPVQRFQAPVWLHQVHGVPSPQVSLAEILLTCGYLNANALNGLFVGWRSLLGSLKPDLLVADYAPTAILAARSLGIHSAAIGIGFSMPPDVSPLPSIRDWESVQPGRLHAADQQMLNSINAVLQRHSGLAFKILATDISTKVLDLARTAIYTKDQTAPVPAALKRKYLLSGHGSQESLRRIAPALRQTVSFHQLNLMSLNYGIKDHFEVIFCRNVLIYFDRPTQEAVINKLCSHLVRGGYLFIGHSESLQGMNVPVVSVGAACYKKEK